MALLAFYKFRFESEQGAEYSINVLKNNYAGSVKQRPLGGSPTLRRDKSDNILGTSLEFPAECNVDGEFAELYTTDSRKYKVNLVDADNNIIWQGFITPELYSEPDIAPPYDVNLTATDGLGELKRVKYTKRGPDSLKGHLQYLLDYTGLSLSIVVSNDIRTGSVTAINLWSSVNVDLDHLAGETCYDVLQALMQTFNAKITQNNGVWYIYRETGLSVSGGNVSARNISAGQNVSVPVPRYGSAATYGWWPVGQMSSEVIPAKHSAVLNAPNFYKDDIVRLPWSGVAGATYDSTIGAWICSSGGDGISNIVSFSVDVATKLVLLIKARNVGAGTTEGNMNLVVKATGTSYAGATTFYLKNAERSHRNDGTDYDWTTSPTSCTIPLQAPADEDSDSDYIELQVIIPLYRHDSRIYFYASRLDITISNATGAYEQRIYGVSLFKYEQLSGYKQTIDIDSDARGEMSGIDLAFSRVASDNVYFGIEEAQTGIPATSSGKVTDWKSNSFTSAMDFLSLISRDYALSIALPRLSRKGTLNVPTSFMGIPMFLTDGTDDFIVESASWRIADDEVDVEAISVPNATITVDGESVEGGESTNTTQHAQGGSSGSSPSPTPGGGTVTSVGLSASDEFSVTGSPVTSAGTLALTLKADRKILTTTEYNYLIAYAHAHSNLSVLNGITSTKVGHWDAAYSVTQNGVVTSLAGLQGDITQAQLQALVDAGTALQAPRLRVIYLNNKQIEEPVIRIDHPVLGTVQGAEAVLMVKSGRNHASYPLAQQGRYARYRRNSWTVARSRNGSRTCKTTSQAMTLVSVFDYIAKYYTRIGTRTHSQMESTSYGAWHNPASGSWQKLSGVHVFGWPDVNTSANLRTVKTFGIAVRIPNPEFEQYATGTVSEHTQCLKVTEGGVTRTIPRYIATDVARMAVQILEAGTEYVLGLGVL